MEAEQDPPPYSAVVATAGPFDIPDIVDTGLPFAQSDRLVVKIRALVSEGGSLYTQFQDVRDVVSASAKFEYQESAIVLCQRFEALLWESRSLAGSAFVTLKDFNEVILDFFSEPNATAEDRLKELSDSSKTLRQARDSAVEYKSSLDALIREVEGFYRTMRLELGAPLPKRQRQNYLIGIGGSRFSRKTKASRSGPRSQLNCFSTVVSSFGAFSQTCMNYALRAERIAETTLLPSSMISPETQQMSPTPPTPSSNSDTNPAPERKRLCLAILAEHTDLADLPVLVDTLVHDLYTFVRHVDVFSLLLSELTREQDIFTVYLKDGQSVANQAYRSEINRLRRHLPSICGALNDYSKARSS